MGTDPILYSFRRCPYAMRARLALAVSGVRHERREVKLPAKPAEMLEASPKGTVPVLVLPVGAVIDESLDIMVWALGHSDPDGWLDRHDPALVAANDGGFKHDLDRYKYPERHDSDAAAHRASGLEFLATLEARLATSANLCDESEGLADAAIMPFARQFSAVEPEWFAAQPLPRVQAWLGRHLASPRFAAIMERLPPWQPGDAPVMVGESGWSGKGNRETA
ncbi:glutathione S-transferase [Novosphingobium sp.]|uniref:glutathione S-transferase n=1 Tax=Novosphingobium sp. TaxID=1874826 RepID=UPI00286E503C|nr:glutathione S-transferase [Novosphingobium sp.]